MAASRKKARFSDLSQDIPKPQINFKDKINNYGPFVPRIRKKPHSLPGNPLPKALIEYNSVGNGQSDVPMDESVFEHPYKKELENLEFSDVLLSEVEPESATFLEEACTVISSTKELLSVIQKLGRCKEIAVDLEGHTYRSYQGFTCLIQISTRTEDFLIDALALRSEIHCLNEVFTNPSIVKVLHGSGQDVLWLQRDFGVYVVNLFDTDLAARTAGHQKSSLDYLLSRYCGVESKEKAEMQMTDWRVRPLSEKMRTYAQKDTHYLLYLYDILKNELLVTQETDGADAGSADSKLLRVFKESREICLRTYKKPTSLTFIEKNRRKLKTSQLELMQLLCEWREGVAQELDESMGYVMPNSMLLEIVKKMPNSVYKLFPQKRLKKHPLIEVDAQKIAGFLKHATKLKRTDEVIEKREVEKQKSNERSSNKHIYFSDSDGLQPAKKVKTD